MSNYTETFTSGPGDTVDSTELETQFDDISAAIATKLDSDGSGTMSGDLDMGNNSITDVSDPVNAQDAATLNYLAVRQVVVGTFATDQANGTTTIANTGLTVSITPRFSDSRIIIFANAYVATENVSAGSVASRTSSWQIYRSSGGTPAVITATVQGAFLVAGSSGAGTISDRLAMIGTEVPGAGTHDYVLRFVSSVAGVQAQFKGASGTQATMMAVEVQP